MKRSPDHDLILETFNELEAEAQITPTVLEFPGEVIEAIEAYEKAHSLDRDRLIGLATATARTACRRMSSAPSRI
jgi:hypothetical protein